MLSLQWALSEASCVVPALQRQHPICTQRQSQGLFCVQKAEQPSKQGKLYAAKPQQSPEELERLREARAKAAESRATKEQDILARLAAERKEARPLSLWITLLLRLRLGCVPNRGIIALPWAGLNKGYVRGNQMAQHECAQLAGAPSAH